MHWQRGTGSSPDRVQMCRRDQSADRALSAKRRNCPQPARLLGKLGNAHMRPPNPWHSWKCSSRTSRPQLAIRSLSRTDSPAVLASFLSLHRHRVWSVLRFAPYRPCHCRQRAARQDIMPFLLMITTMVPFRDHSNGAKPVLASRFRHKR